MVRPAAALVRVVVLSLLLARKDVCAFAGKRLLIDPDRGETLRPDSGTCRQQALRTPPILNKELLAVEKP